MATDVISIIRQGTTNAGLTRVSNVVTVTLSTGTQLNPQPGDSVVVSSVTPSSFNGTHTIVSRISATEYTYAQTGADESSTTHGVSGGDYGSISAWEAVEQGDLVAADERRIAECYNDWPSGLSNTVIIDGSTTDATRYLVIRAAAGQAHTDVPGTGFWMYSNNAGVSAIDVRDPYTLIEQIEAAVTSTISGFGRGIYLSSGSSDSVVQSCIARSLAASGSAIQALSAAARVSVRACLAHDSLNGIRAAATTHTIDNCTAADCGTGFDASAAALVRNSVAYNNTTNWNGTWSGSSTHNATSSGSDDAPGANSVTGVNSSDFVDAANNNFHLASGSILIGAGTNLYSNFTTDIDGDTWPSSGAWDIGFDYRVTAGGATDLTVSEASHGHAADSLTLSIGVSLAINDATHGHAADAVTLTTASTLAVADATHAHAADQLTLTLAGSESLTIADATHAHTADAPVLSVDSLLAVDDAMHAHSADNVVLGVTGVADLIIADATHAHSVDGLVLTSESLLAIQDALHAHAADALTIDSAPTLLIADALHAHTSDGLLLTVDAWLVIADARHAHAADVVALTVAGGDLSASPGYTITGRLRAFEVRGRTRRFEVDQ